MTPLNRLRAFTATALATHAACAYAGVKLLPRRPITGGLLGFFVAGPAISYVEGLIIAPDAAQTLKSLMEPEPAGVPLAQANPNPPIPVAPTPGATNDLRQGSYGDD